MEVHTALLVDVVIGVSLVEAMVLLLHRRLTGRGLAAADLLPNLGAGLCLMLALRAAVAGSSGLWVAAALAAAGLSHGLDLHRRLRPGRRAPGGKLQ